MKASILTFLEVVIRTGGDVFHVMSMAVLLAKIKRTKSCSGISLKSQILYLCVYAWRYIDILYAFLYPHIIVSTTRMMYNTVMKCVFISTQSYIIFNIVNHYYYSYDSEFDDAPLGMVLGVALISGAFLTKTPRSTEYYYLVCIINWLWTSSVVLESVSIIPQLVLLQKAGEGESLTVHYVIFLGVYRVLYIVSWLIKWMNTGVISQILLCGSIVQSLFYTNFFMIYINSFISHGKSLRIYPKRFFQEAFEK